jgi:hypothetical protein
MTRPKTDRIVEELNRIRRQGKEFSPSELAFRLNVTPKEITSVLRYTPGAKLIRKAHCRRFGSTSYLSPAAEPMYYPSVWGFLKEGMEVS